MAKKKRKRKGLDVMAEEFAMSLIFDASGGRIGRSKAQSIETDIEDSVSFRDKRALLDSITKLLGAQKEQDDDETGGLDSFREHLRGGNSGETSSGADTDDSNTEV